MLQITQTSINKPLGNFIVRDDTGSYDNEYNDALLHMERQEALKAAGRELVHLSAKHSLSALKWLGEGALSVTEQLVEAAH